MRLLHGRANVVNILVSIDLSDADLALFDDYEKKVLAILPLHGAALRFRVRATDGSKEFHLLDFPDANAREQFLSDPARIAARSLWDQCGATSNAIEVADFVGF